MRCSPNVVFPNVMIEIVFNTRASRSFGNGEALWSGASLLMDHRQDVIAALSISEKSSIHSLTLSWENKQNSRRSSKSGRRTGYELRNQLLVPGDTVFYRPQFIFVEWDLLPEPQ